MMNQNEKILRQKEKLALRTLQVAEDSLTIIQASLDDCSTEDLVKIFNSSVKAHRDFISDAAALTEVESKSEKELTKEYTGTAAELIKRFKPQV